MAAAPVSRVLVLTAAVLLAAAVFSASPAQSCSSTGAIIGAQLTSFPVPLLTNDSSSYVRYDALQVRTHFADQQSARFRSPTATTFSCVDARGDDQLLGTAGGDLAEVVASIIAYFKYSNQAVTKATINTIFNSFFTRVASIRRPLYFHTDDNRLRRLFQLVQGDIGGPLPAILPNDAPANAEVWLKHMVKAEVQGCGHVRLMLAADTSPFYSVKLSGAAVTNCVNVTASDCIDSSQVAAQVIDQFFRSWWFSPRNSINRNSVAFTVDVGPLIGKAVAIVSHAPEDGSCGHQAAMMTPNHAGSTVFMYHDTAVKQFRTFATRVAFRDLVPAVDRPRFVALWNEVAGQQLGATLTYLAPANNLPIFPVTITTVPSGGPISGH